MSELLWVAVPGGVLRDGEAVLRVVIVPRLTGLADDAVVSVSAMADWPGVLAGATLTVHTAESVTAERVPLQARRLDAEQVRPGLWPRMFPPGMAVRSFQPPGTYSVPEVDPTTENKETIEDVYRSAAANPGDAFSIGRRLSTTDVKGRQPVRRGPDEVRAPTVPEPDFHRVSTMLREHPAVLQALGLIVELRLPDPQRLAGTGLVSVDAQLAGPAGEELTTVSPLTSYLFERGRFVPAPENGSDIALGMLDLTPEHWQFATFDVTGAVESLREAAPGRRTPTVGATTLPGLRSAGLSLMRRGRQAQLERRVDTAIGNAGRETLADAVLFADDLMLGYRVDVRTDVGGWSSLMLRAATYTTPDLEPIVDGGHIEEGQVKANAVTVEGAGATMDDPAEPPRRRDQLELRGDEVVARWDGWSLTCPRALPVPRREGRRLPHLLWSFSPLGLPELRFGTEYRMRVRIADIAGGGLGLNDPEFTEGESGEVFYGRHDPVPPPFLVPPVALLDIEAHPTKLGPGGALDVMVVRSNPAAGETVQDYAARYPVNDRRLLLPPPTSFRLAEEAGRFDGVDQQTAADWLRRATTPQQHDLDGGYSWLPDPVAEGVALTVTPTPGATNAGATSREAWTNPEGAWPHFQGKTVQVVAVESPAERMLDWTAGGRAAVVRMAPGTQVTLALTSTVVNDRIDRFAMHDWLSTPVAGPTRNGRDNVGLSADLLEDVMSLVRTGRHPMVSPPMQLHVVHAVKQPTRPPSATLTATREPGQSNATLVPSHPMLDVDSLSTGQVTLSAKWTEVTDNRPTPVDEVTVQMTRVDPDTTVLAPMTHEFGDTRHRQVTYTVRATSRFRDFFDPEPDEAFQAAPLTQLVDVPSSARPPAPVVNGVYPAFHWSGTELPPNWELLERVRGGGRLRVELARPWHLSGDDERLGVVLIAGASTARRWTTTIRRDPIWPSPLPPTDPTPDLVLGAVGDPVTLPLADAGENVVVVPFGPQFVEAEGGAPGYWFADVEMPEVAEGSYCPFVQLAVVRYQPHSLAGLHLSQVVRTEPAQLMPDRRLIVERRDGVVTVQLRGLTPSRNQDADLLEHPDDVTHPPLVRAHLEQWTGAGPPTELTATRPELAGGWQRIASVSAAVGSNLPALVLPSGGGPLRLVVREVERFMMQTEPSGPADQLNERAVFVDVVDLS